MSKPDINIPLLPVQWDALTTRATECLYHGSRGSGKSLLLRYAAILFALYVPGIQIYLFRKKYNDLFSNHIYGHNGFINVLKPLTDMGRVKITYNPAPKIEFYHEGAPTAIIFPRHCQHDHDVENYRGAEIHLLLLDEATHFSKFVLDALRRSMRLGSHKIDYSTVKKYLTFVDDGFFPKAIYATNPGGISSNYFRSSFVKAAPSGKIFKAPTSDGGMTRVHIQALIQDNYFLLAEDPTYVDRLYTGTRAEVQMNLYGDWDVVSGGCFDDVWDIDTHIIEPFIIPRQWYVDRAMDYGNSKPFAVMYFAESDGTEVVLKDGTKRAFPRGTIFILDELYGWNGEENVGSRMTANETGRAIAEKEIESEWGALVRSGPGDWQIFETNRGGLTETIQDHYIDGYNATVNEYRKHGSARLMKCTNHLFFPADKSAGSRVRGLSLFRTYLKNASQWPMEDKGLFIFDKCVHTMRTIPTLEYDEVKPEDVNTNMEDHIYDAIRYRLQTPPTRYQHLELGGL